MKSELFDMVLNAGRWYIFQTHHYTAEVWLDHSVTKLCAGVDKVEAEANIYRVHGARSIQ